MKTTAPPIKESAAPKTTPATPAQRSYQDLLDESLQETFPASDPISPASATQPAPARPAARKP